MGLKVIIKLYRVPKAMLVGERDLIVVEVDAAIGMGLEGGITCRLFWHRRVVGAIQVTLSLLLQIRTTASPATGIVRLGALNREAPCL